MNLDEMYLMKAVHHLEEVKMKGNQIKWQIGVVICLLAISGILKNTIAAADHPGLEEGVTVEGQGGEEAVVAPPLAAADHPGLEEGVRVGGQGGQEAVAALPAPGGITMATDEGGEMMMMMRRCEKGKLTIVFEEGESSKSKEEEEEESKNEKEEESKEKEEGAVTKSDQGRESYNLVHHHNSTINRTNVISLQNGPTGRRRVTWLDTVTIIGDDEDTAVAVAVAEADLPSRSEQGNRLSNREVEVSNVQYAFATNGSGSNGSLANGYMGPWLWP